MLTHKQRELLIFIETRLRETGVSPSFEEMRDALGLYSKSGVHRLVNALEERGFLRRLKRRARALEIVKLPHDLNARSLAGNRQRRFTPSVVEGGLAQSPPGADEAQESNVVILPVMGQIAAGSPAEAIQDHLRNIAVPEEILGAGEHFALEVKGDSMIGAGIFNGDTAVIQKTDAASNGDIVVAIIENQEATLKYLRKKGGAVALEAANPVYETRIFRPDQITIQGKMSALFRAY